MRLNFIFVYVIMESLGKNTRNICIIAHVDHGE